MKSLFIATFFLIPTIASASDFCQSYRDGIRTYDNILKVAEMTPRQDWDQDGIENGDELRNGTNPCADNTRVDTDQDGLIDFYEEHMGNNVFVRMDPKKRDTDGNGVDDLVQLCQLKGDDRARFAIAGELIGDVYPAIRDYFILDKICGK